MENADKVSYESEDHKQGDAGSSFLKDVEQELSREDHSMLQKRGRETDSTPYQDSEHHQI
jgi:hypothetical protein